MFGLSGLDRLFCFMIVQQLQYFLKYLTRCVCLLMCFVCLEKGACLFTCIVYLSFFMQNTMSRSLLKTQDFVKALAVFGKSVKDPQVLIRKDPKRKM